MASTKEGSWFDLYTADIETQLRVSFDGRATRSGLAWRLIADLVLCNLLFGQCVVAYWRGTWELALHYSALQYGEDCSTPNMIFLLFGLAVSIALRVFRYHIRDHVAGGIVDKLRFKIVTFTYCFVIGTCDILFWKGLWNGLDCWLGTGDGWLAVAPNLKVATMVAGTIALFATRHAKSAAAATVFIVIDLKHVLYEVGTALEYDESKSLLKHTLDVCLTSVIQSFVVLVWHGLWGFQDWLLVDYFRISWALSAWTSLAVGGFTFVMVVLMQLPVLRIYRSATVDDKWSLAKKSVSNLVLLFITGFSSITTFRGGWLLMDAYLHPDDYVLSRLNALVFAALILLTGRMTYSLVPSISKDWPKSDDYGMLSFYMVAYHYAKDLKAVKGAKTKQDPEA